MADKDKDIYNIGASTRRILFGFLDELKEDDKQKENDGRTITKSKQDVKLFSGKLSKPENADSQKTNDENHKSTKEFVLSKDEQDKLKSVNENPNEDD
ncbi:hypothetical protein [Candidatus Uabimicrobium sp. HlEnr_7]|uniref:hypothetical protein n=1 Tax=Candidatus Uabimicrobium helgolandensis TaxID=3095367 RepID=UPI003555DD1E